MSSNITREQLAAEKPIVNPNLLVSAPNVIVCLSWVNVIIATWGSGHLDRHTTLSSVILEPTCALTICSLQLRLCICLCRHSLYYNYSRAKGHYSQFGDASSRIVCVAVSKSSSDPYIHMSYMSDPELSSEVLSYPRRTLMFNSLLMWLIYNKKVH